MKWIVEIQKTGLKHRNLSDLLDGLGFQLVDGIDFEAIYSPYFDEFKTANQVWEEAKKIRNSFTGPASIDSEFTLGSVIDCSAEPRKRHAFLEVDPIRFTVTMGPATLTLSLPVKLSQEKLKEWQEDRAEEEYQSKLKKQLDKLEPAFLEERASKVLKLLSTDSHTGESLYKTYELLEQHPSKRKSFQNKFNLDENQFNRFNDAVHNPVVSGDLARHAYEKKPKTINPMTMNEANIFIQELAQKWLTSIRNKD